MFDEDKVFAKYNSLLFREIQLAFLAESDCIDVRDFIIIKTIFLSLFDIDFTVAYVSIDGPL